jgi:hypothetical protein
MRMFKENKYTKWYYNIVKNASLRILNSVYTESHHIVPKSLGGNNNLENLVSLTSREHFICHLLLTRMTEGSNKSKMIHAAFSMIHWNNEKINSRIYEKLKQEVSHIMKNNNPMFNEETRKKVSNTNLGKPGTFKGRKHSEETKEKLRVAALNRPNAPWNKGTKGLCKGNPGLVHSTETKKIISEKISAIRKGKTHSEETKRKMAESTKKRWEIKNAVV